ncbi:hypothetical protein BN77_p10496 [Rhizobium mesoamericanum STM3625]|uniref:Uncharacterized protein n=1 Tax=Rhizobium mesoamericanum STM3625 TaxID=1211777 RepID=K0Q444_9HYPH|nr:hypothetical protein BN77_p10496 [Rhizobium mesoamericanum STM3625]
MSRSRKPMKKPSDAQASRWETAAAAKARGCRFDRLKRSYSDEIAHNSNQGQSWLEHCFVPQRRSRKVHH